MRKTPSARAVKQKLRSASVGIVLPFGDLASMSESLEILFERLSHRVAAAIDEALPPDTDNYREMREVCLRGAMAALGNIDTSRGPSAVHVPQVASIVERIREIEDELNDVRQWLRAECANVEQSVKVE